jgi:hypothetical protein
MTREDALRLRHGCPPYAHACNDCKTFMSRQIISGEVEATAGETMRLTGMPGGHCEGCVIDNESAE